MFLQPTSDTANGINVMAKKQAKPYGRTPADYKDPSLRRWRVVEVERKNGTRTRHVWGHDVANNAGRASTTIKEFNVETMTVVTHSGRIYKLLGLPGHARKGEYAWQQWCRINGVISEVDVTDEYFDPGKWLDSHDIGEIVR
jgi:hypothetical protein